MEKNFGKGKTEEFGEQNDQGGDVQAHQEPVHRLAPYNNIYHSLKKILP